MSNVPFAPRHPTEALRADETHPYDDSPTGDVERQRAALYAAAMRAADPAHVSELQTTEPTARQRAGLDT